MAVLRVLGIVVIVLIASAVALDIRRRKRLLLDGAAGVMDKVDERDSKGIRGVKNGIEVLVNWGKDGEGRYFTTVGCTLPHTKFALELWPQTEERQRRIQKGQMIDVQVGEPLFDLIWVVEGAPADVVRRVLDDRVRAGLMGLGMEELAQPSQRELRLRARGLREPEWVEAAIAVMAQISAAVDPAIAASDRDAAVKSQMTGAPYRGEVRTTDAAARRSRELEQLRETRRARQVWVAMKWVSIAVGVIAFVASVRYCR
jgi:hypothetical protein